jgi:hypothetical protein
MLVSMFSQKGHFDQVSMFILHDSSVKASTSTPINGVQSNVSTGSWSDPSFMRRTVNLHSLFRPYVIMSIFESCRRPQLPEERLKIVPQLRFVGICLLIVSKKTASSKSVVIRGRTAGRQSRYS